MQLLNVLDLRLLFGSDNGVWPESEFFAVGQVWYGIRSCIRSLPSVPPCSDRHLTCRQHLSFLCQTGQQQDEQIVEASYRVKSAASGGEM